MGKHRFEARLIWEGNRGEGTADYRGYGRQYRVLIDGKPDLTASAAPEFRGDAALHNPEDLFLAAISACHMLTYLAVCALAGIRVVSYEDSVNATMSVDRDGGGRFDEVTLHPVVTIAAGSDEARASALHAKAHEQCFIANSCSVPIRHEPTVKVEE